MSDHTTPAPASEQVEYRPVAGFPRYRVGDDGSVWSLRRGVWRPLRLQKSTGGYRHVNLCRVEGGSSKQHSRHVHRLVLEAFAGPRPPGMESRHLDGNAANNRLPNLRWGTHAQNQADRVAHGTAPRGERGGNAKLTAAAVLEIRRRIRGSGRSSSAALAREFGVTQQCVFRVVKRLAWAHLPDEGVS